MPVTANRHIAIRKGAADAIRAYVDLAGGIFPQEIGHGNVDEIARTRRHAVGRASKAT